MKACNHPVAQTAGTSDPSRLVLVARIKLISSKPLAPLTCHGQCCPPVARPAPRGSFESHLSGLRPPIRGRAKRGAGGELGVDQLVGTTD